MTYETKYPNESDASMIRLRFGFESDQEYVRFSLKDSLIKNR